MANQIVVSAGAKVRNLQDVIIGTSGVLTSLGFDVANGVPRLDVNGKILVSQLPNSVMEYLGTWNAATNTPTLANGTGNQGDVYLCNVAGTVDFGAGAIAFVVGDQVIYSGSIWQRASGATGTVTSVAITESGDSLNITGSPITTSGTINIGFNGTNLQYVNGAGNLTTFPILTGYVPYTGATTNVDLGVYDLTSRLIKIDGSSNGGSLNIKQNATTILSGIGYNCISAKSDTSLQLYYGNATIATFRAVLLNVNNLIDGSTRTFEFPDANGTIALTSDIPILTGYVPYTGATANVDLGTFNLTADVITGATGSFASNGGSDTFAINHSSGAGIALNITKGGNGEGLYINKTSGSGNAATIIGTLNATTLVKSGGTSSQFLKADGTVDSSAYIALTGLSATAPLSYNNTTGGFTISQAGVSGNGYLSSTDWNTFNNKQASGSYITALSGEATASGPGSAAVTLSTSAVTGKLLTGVNITGGSISATDSILVAFGKVQNQINGVLGGAIYQSVWNASTNSPTLTSGTGTKGYYYIVSVAGSTNLDGITDWKVGDWAIFNGTTWNKVDNTDAVSSVNGFTGAVSLTTANISEVTNLYYTEGRVSANTDVAANTAARHAAVTIGTANGLSLSTQALSLGLASTSATGALSSTDWNTFNLKQAALSGTGFVKISGSTISYDNSTYYLASNPQAFISLLSLSSSATGLTYTNTTGVFSFTAGYSIPTNASQTQWDTAYSNRISTLNGLTAATQNFSTGMSGTDFNISSTTATHTFNIPSASATARGLLSSADWTTFNNKQSALTNPVTGTGTTNYLPKFTGASTIGNSAITDDGTTVTLVSRALSGTSATFTSNMNADDYNMAGWKILDWTGSVAQIGGITSSQWNQLEFFTSGTSKLILNGSGNLGLGVTPSAWWSGARSMQIGLGGSIAARTSSDFAAVELSANQIINTSAQRVYIGTGFASLYEQFDGAHKWLTSTTSGTAGNAITFTQAMTLTAAGRLLINKTNEETYQLDVNGTGRFSNQVTVGSDLFLSLGTASIVFNSAANYNTQIYQTGGSLVLYTGANPRLTIASTGAATFSSSVTNTSGMLLNVGATGTNANMNYTTFTNGVYSALNSATPSEGVGMWSDNLGNAMIGALYNNTASSLNLVVRASSSVSGLVALKLSGTGAATFSSSVTAGGTSTTPTFWAKGGMDGSGTGKGNIRSSDAGGSNYWDFGRDNLTTGNFVLTSGGGSPLLSITTGGAATFSSSVTASSFFESSDSRLKTLIQDNYQTKGIASITPKLYTKNGKVELGYYAQDFVGILDSAVSKGSDDMLSLSYREVHTAKIYALEQRIKELETK
jgi:hypothetical protein